MLDKDLAALYETETKRLTEAVKRNIKRFPPDFMFQLTATEWSDLRSQFAALESGRGQHRKYLPYVFSEQGVAMLSGLLTSDIAISMNIAIMRAFIGLRKMVIVQSDLKEQFQLIGNRIDEHDIQLNKIYDVMENLLDEKAAQVKWENRERIGFT